MASVELSWAGAGGQKRQAKQNRDAESSSSLTARRPAAAVDSGGALVVASTRGGQVSGSSDGLAPQGGPVVKRGRTSASYAKESCRPKKGRPAVPVMYRCRAPGGGAGSTAKFEFKDYPSGEAGAKRAAESWCRDWEQANRA